MYAADWKLSQANMVLFPMISALGVEVTGLGNGFTVQVSKAGAAFQASAGTKAELSLGIYSYICTAAEADTYGPVVLVVTGAGCIQQTLEYVVQERTITAIAFTYTVTNSVTLAPIEGVTCWFTTDIAGLYVVATGVTDAFGVARNGNGNLPRLDPGTYYVFRQKAGFEFDDPDTEIVS